MWVCDDTNMAAYYNPFCGTVPREVLAAVPARRGQTGTYSTARLPCASFGVRMLAFTVLLLGS